jgi:hypothetical protein
MLQWVCTGHNVDMRHEACLEDMGVAIAKAQSFADLAATRTIWQRFVTLTTVAEQDVSRWRTFGTRAPTDVVDAIRTKGK